MPQPQALLDGSSAGGYRLPVNLDSAIGGAVAAVLIGLLLGFERQRAHSQDEELFAGVRTFPLLTLAGYLGARTGEPWLLAVMLALIGALVVTAYVRTSHQQAGVTTEVVALIAPLLGVLVQHGEAMLAASAAVLVALLLTLKAPLHRIAGSVSEAEVFSILKFAVVAVVLVPVLPREAMGPYGAVVPYQVGLVVVILCAVSLGGYLLVRVLGSHAGWALAGLLGGLVSSTAVTLSFAGKAREAPGLERALAVGILLASTILYARGLFLAGLFDPELAYYLAPRLAALFVVAVLFAAFQYRKAAGDAEPGPMALGNPVELGRAMTLAVIFAAVLVVARVAQERIGARGLMLTGVLGGLVDVDSVTVAVARMRKLGLTPVAAAAGSYLLATLSNLALKGGLVAVVGGVGLARRVLPAFATIAAATIAMLLL